MFGRSQEAAVLRFNQDQIFLAMNTGDDRGGNNDADSENPKARGFRNYLKKGVL